MLSLFNKIFKQKTASFCYFVITLQHFLVILDSIYIKLTINYPTIITHLSDLKYHPRCWNMLEFQSAQWGSTIRAQLYKHLNIICTPRYTPFRHSFQTGKREIDSFLGDFGFLKFLSVFKSLIDYFSDDFVAVYYLPANAEQPFVDLNKNIWALFHLALSEKRKIITRWNPYIKHSLSDWPLDWTNDIGNSNYYFCLFLMTLYFFHSFQLLDHDRGNALFLNLDNLGLHSSYCSTFWTSATCQNGGCRKVF